MSACPVLILTNNGTCSGMVNGLNCGYSGVICDVEIMECVSNPCKNNGTCYDLIGYFTCDCMPGYTGDTCAINFNDCDPNLLVYITGYTDANCMTNIDSYNPSPCQNNETCNDLMNNLILVVTIVLMMTSGTSLVLVEVASTVN